jgi:hypothetical protein
VQDAEEIQNFESIQFDKTEQRALQAPPLRKANRKITHPAMKSKVQFGTCDMPNALNYIAHCKTTAWKKKKI